MTDLKILEKKINELEKRLNKIEEKISSPADAEEKAWMDQLYIKAKEIVIRHNKASVIFLQKKLLIDYQRAIRLLKDLETNGVIEPELGTANREVIVK